MSGPTIMVVKTGTIDAALREAMAEHGVLIVEASEPSEVRLLQVEPPLIDSSDMLYAAIRAIAAAGSTSVAQNFVLALRESMHAARERPPPRAAKRDPAGRFAKPEPTP